MAVTDSSSTKKTMKILAVADTESAALWDFYEKDKLADIDLILSAGDVDSRFLSFLVTMTNVPTLYVHGNHDKSYNINPPEGCICIDNKIYVHNGIRILGLGGCMRYNFGPYQYTEAEMTRSVQRLALPLLRHKGFDILLTHSPAKGVHDGEDLPHRGFQVFNTLIEKYHPAYHIHGHMHLNYDYRIPREDRVGSTRVINAHEKVFFEI